MGEENSTETSGDGWCKCRGEFQCEREKTRTSAGKSIGHSRCFARMDWQSALCFLQTLKRFNALLTSNGSLRSEIDNLRNERERYENLSQKSENELRDLRTQLVECIERSVTSYDQR